MDLDALEAAKVAAEAKFEAAKQKKAERDRLAQEEPATWATYFAAVTLPRFCRVRVCVAANYLAVVAWPRFCRV